jgi:hypothetical protein
MKLCDTANNLVKACNDGTMPLLRTQADCGLVGFGGSNPVDVYTCYRTAILDDGVTALDIDRHLRTGTLGDFILSQDNVKRLACYDRVNGLKSAWTTNMVT